MNLNSSSYLGIRYLFRKDRTGKVSFRLKGAIIGIGLSLIPLIVVIVVANGMIEGITKRYVEIGSYHFQIKNFASSDESGFDKIRDDLLRNKDIINVIPVINGVGLAYSPEGRCGAAVRALPPESYDTDPAMKEFLEFKEGGFDLSDGKSVLLSTEIAAKLGVSIGDEIKILTAMRRTGRAPVLRPNSFTVKGIFTTGYYELDSLAVYIPLSRGKMIFTDPGSFFIGLKVSDPYGRLDKLEKYIAGNIPDEWYIYTWFEIERPMYKGFQTTKLLLVFIMVLIVIVASVNISSSMVMLIIEKSGDIAILKAIGGKPSDITLSFLLSGLVIGITGTIIGIGAGLLIAVNINEIINGAEIAINAVLGFFGNISPFASVSPRSVDLIDSAYYLERIPFRISMVELLFVASLTIFLSAVAAYIPARKAGKVKPLEILRKH